MFKKIKIDFRYVFKISLAVILFAMINSCNGTEEPSSAPEVRLSRLSLSTSSTSSTLSTLSAFQDAGNFSVLTYNVAGLPGFISSAETDRQSATEQISCYVNEFDFVNVQEDFNYHAALYDTCDNHPYRSPTTGGAVIGSGLNSMSRFPFTDWARISWDDCNGVDCLTPKGFTMARVRLAEGVYVDIYNLHTQAQTGDADLEVRRKNILQLARYIENESAGNAVIVMGDTNTRYTRSGDNIRELMNRGFSDVWVTLTRDGDVPTSGEDALVCDPRITSRDCEIVDKVLFRDNGFVGLQAVEYVIRQDAIIDGGLDLSDHPPVQANFTYSIPADRRLSDQWGGPHGTAFNDVSLLPETPVVSNVTIGSGDRVDRVELTMANSFVFSHGGSGGSDHSLTLGNGEYIASVQLCSGQEGGRTRIFYAKFITNLGRSLSGGSTTPNTITYSAPEGWQIVGFHGRSADEVDKLGVIYAPYEGSTASAATYQQIVNQASGLYMDIDGGNMSPGTNVLQWQGHDGDWQKWNYDEVSGLIRSKNDPRYCLDNSGDFANGSNIVIWTCSGNANQRFTMNGNGVIRMRSFPEQAVDGYGTSAGDNIGTWRYWGGANQFWNLIE